MFDLGSLNQSGCKIDTSVIEVGELIIPVLAGIAEGGVMTSRPEIQEVRNDINNTVYVLWRGISQVL